MGLFNRSDKNFKRELYELYDIKKMLQKEGEGDGESSYKVFVATLLLFIDLSLHRIGLTLFFLLCFVIGKFLTSGF